MTDSDEEDALLVCLFGLGAQFIIENDHNQKKRRRMRSIWVRDWVRRRNELGCYGQLLRELENEVPQLYKNFLRMNIADFNNLLELVSPLIKKEDTNMREAISPGERLALTLRFLATGDSFMSLQYLFRIPQTTISTIIPEVCDAIYKVLLPDFLKVISPQFFNLFNNYKRLYFSFHQLRKIGCNWLVTTMIGGIFRIVLALSMESTS